MTPRLRKFVLTSHVACSVGWLGAVAAYLALAIGGDTQAVGALAFVGWLVIVPFSLAALLTGLALSLGTEWGLFRHYWVLAKFLLTVPAITILLLHMPAVSRAAAAEHGGHRVPFIVHAGGGLLVLLAATTLSIYKPWGRTRFGRR
jgi:hypothetical protein